MRVRREAERFRRSIEEKRMGLGEAEHDDLEIRDAVVEEMEHV